MNNGFFSGICVLVLAMVVAVSTVFNVVSNDAMRGQVESLIAQTRDIREKIEDMRIAAPLQLQSQSSVVAAPVQEVANREFYDQTAPSGGRIIRATSADTNNMNYIINNDYTVSVFWGLTSSSLAERNYAEPEKFQPLIAESWEICPDKKTYHIKLRKGVLWHDFTDPVSGKEWKNVEVTAKDFKFYVDVVKDPHTDCAPLKTYMDDIDHVEIINDYEFTVRWKREYFLSESITLSLSPLPKHLYHAYDGPFDGKKFNEDHQRNRIIVGCGPYEFVKWDKGQRILFRRFNKYFGRNLGIMPPITQLAFELIKHPNTRFQALLAEKIDQMGLTPEQWISRTGTKEFGKNGFIKKFKYPGRSYSYIGYNLKKPLFQDRKVRLALTHLVNRERILKEVYHNLGQIVSGPFFIGSPACDQSIKPYEFSVKTAKRLLAESGWKDSDGDGVLDKDGQKFSFNIMQVANHPMQQKMLPIIKEDMAKAGVEMNIQIVEWSVLVQRLEQKSFDVCVLGWSMSFESDPYQIWHSSQADKLFSSNHIGFNNKQADKIIEKIRVTFDHNERVKLYHEFHRLIHEEQPYTFLIAPLSLQAINSRYRNVREFPLGIPDSIQWVPEGEQRSAF
ncbi:MAG: peptide-binding protein [Victivallales bacterium]|nr:peptide-binding protein [Victivallales bacterium]